MRQNYKYICESWSPGIYHRAFGRSGKKGKNNLGWLLHDKLFSKWQIHTSSWWLHVTSAQHLQWIFTSGWRRRITQGGPFSFLQSQHGRDREEKYLWHNHMRKKNQPGGFRRDGILCLTVFLPKVSITQLQSLKRKYFGVTRSILSVLKSSSKTPFNVKIVQKSHIHLFAICIF